MYIWRRGVGKTGEGGGICASTDFNAASEKLHTSQGGQTLLQDAFQFAASPGWSELKHFANKKKCRSTLSISPN
jgi:hypothetical protein